jgi:hypothetical protein
MKIQSPVEDIFYRLLKLSISHLHDKNLIQIALPDKILKGVKQYFMNTISLRDQMNFLCWQI